MFTFTVKLSSLKFEDRLIPAFYHDLLIQRRNSKLKYCLISQYFDVSDGEHSHIHRNSSGGIRYFYGRDIKEEAINFDPVSDDSYVLPEDFEKFPRCHVSDGDLLMPIYGTIGKSAIYFKKRHGVAGVPRHIGILTLKPGVKDIDQYFLSCYFRNKSIRSKLIGASTGNIQKLLSLTTIKQTEIVLPDADLLSSVSNNERDAISLEAKAFSLLEDAKNLVYQKLPFDIRGIQEKKSFSVKLSDFETHDNSWSASLYRNLYIQTVAAVSSHPHFILSEYYSFEKGVEVGSKQYVSYCTCDFGAIPFIRTSDVVNNSPDYYTDFFVSSSEFSKSSVPSGRVLFTKDGKIGCVAMTDSSNHFLVSSGFAIFNVLDPDNPLGLTNEYLFTLLSMKEIGRYQGLMGTVVASTIPHLREDKINNFILPLLSKEDIEKVTSLVKEAFEDKAKRLDLLKKDDLLLDSFIKKAF